jgi:tetratricopeptide (TPR) repeat protein
MASEKFGGLESLQVLLQQNPESLTFARVADALMQNGRLDEAIQICEEGVRRYPYYVTGHMVLGKCYLKKKLFDQAEKEFKRVLLFDPKYIAAHKYYGDLMREIGWENTFVTSYQKILQIDPLDGYIQGIVEEHARKTGSQPPKPDRESQLETIPAKRSVKPRPIDTKLTREPSPAPPTQEIAPLETAEDLLPPSGFGEDEFIRYQPPPSEADRLRPWDSEKKSELEFPSTPIAPSTPLTDTEEERFSYILDDIFQDEVVDERPKVESDKPPIRKSGRPKDGETFFSAQTTSGNDFVFGERKQESPKQPPQGAESREATAQPSPPTSTIPTRPVDFDFDELQPASPEQSEIETTAESTEMDFDEIVKQKSGRSSASRPSPTATNSKTLTPRPEIFEEMEQPAPLPTSEREKIVTPTLGEIYAAQGQYAKAIGVFELLSKKDPNNRLYREKIDYLKNRLQESQNAR